MKQEIDELQIQFDEIKVKLDKKKLDYELVFHLDKMISYYRGGIISPDSVALIATCTQLRAILLAEPVGLPKEE